MEMVTILMLEIIFYLAILVFVARTFKDTQEDGERVE